jgi:probable rRNA maturation factor
MTLSEKTGAAPGQPLELTLMLDVLPAYESEVDNGLLCRVLKKVLAAEGVTGPVEVSLVVADDPQLQALNRQYRNLDRPTDVLSFSQLGEPEAAFPSPAGEARPLGDIVISGDRVRAQAAEYGHSQPRELAYLAVHGLLHLLGYDHETETERQEMRRREEAALAEIPR